MFNRLNAKIAQDARLIACLLLGLGFLFVIILVQSALLFRMSGDFTVYIPPNLDSSATVQVNDVPNANVYGFAFYIFQTLNHWPHNGETDFRQNIYNYSSYMTPNYRQQLDNEYNELYNRGEVQRRVRKMIGRDGDAFDINQVRKISANEWEVILIVQLTEFDQAGVIVKDLDVEYPLRIVRYDVDRQSNPWGLAIAGYTQSPRRLSDHLSGDL